MIIFIDQIGQENPCLDDHGKSFVADALGRSVKYSQGGDKEMRIEQFAAYHT